MSIKTAQRYEAAWHKLFYALPRYKQEAIIEEPNGRWASELAHETVILAETTTEPIIASGKNG